MPTASYWSPKYWAPSYWAPSYWGQSTTAPVTSLLVYPSPAAVIVGNVLQFGVTSSGFSGGVSWSLVGPGTLSSTGLYTAPAVGTLETTAGGNNLSDLGYRAGVGGTAANSTGETVLGTSWVTCTSITIPSVSFTVQVSLVENLAGVATAFGPGMFGVGVWGGEAYAGNGRYEPPALPIAEDFVDAVANILYLTFGQTFSYVGPGLMPTHTPLPYIRLVEQGDDLTWSGNNEANKIRIDHMTLQVTIYAPGRTLSKNLGKQVASVLDDAPLAYSDGYHLQMSMASRMNDQDPDEGPDGVIVWAETMVFDVLAQRLL